MVGIKVCLEIEGATMEERGELLVLLSNGQKSRAGRRAEEITVGEG